MHLRKLREFNKTVIIFIIILTLFNFNSAHKYKWSNDNNLIVEIREILESYVKNWRDYTTDTIPLSNEEINELIDNIPTYENKSNVFESELYANIWLDKVDYVSTKVSERSSILDYNFLTNISNNNQKLIEDFAPIANRLTKKVKYVARKFYNSGNFQNWNSTIKRMLFLLSRGASLLNEDDVRKISSISNELETIYATAKVCRPDTNTECLSLEPELTKIMADSRNHDELLWAWKGWMDAISPKMKHLYTQGVELQNKAALENGYKDLSEIWMEDFETENFENIMDELYEQIKPFYSELHAYVRRKLRDFYGYDKIKSKFIPAHLLGNMWAQNWENINDIVVPFPDVALPKIEDRLKLMGYTPKKMFKEAENFFTSIGLYPMTAAFWENSMLEKPKNVDVQCHASAFDFSNGYDYRIKMCTGITDDDFFTCHHEMGHIEYYMSYKEQPNVFRTGANSGFHEAIGDTIALSVLTPKHLKQIGLYDTDSMSYEATINFMMKIALKKVAFLPFGYMIDKWRWNVFRGIITEDDYNDKWWEMRQKYQGLESVVERSKNDFDPGAKYHIPANVPYARYFISHIHQFQFYQALCKISGHEGDLHKCDFYGSKKAGDVFKEMLSLGSSQHWTQALELLTGEKQISTDALFEYFKPLVEWLKTENAKFPNELAGWE